MYAVPFVPTVIRLPSVLNAVATLGTEPGLVNRSGRPVTALAPGSFPPVPAVADTAAFGEPAWPAVLPPETCRGLPDPWWNKTAARTPTPAAAAAADATASTPRRRPAGLPGGRVAPASTAPPWVPPSVPPVSSAARADCPGYAGAGTL